MFDNRCRASVPACLSEAKRAQAGTLVLRWENTNEREVVTRRNLPHWYVPGAAHSVRFRLAGSLPRDVIERLRQRKEQLSQARFIADGDGSGWLNLQGRGAGSATRAPARTLVLR